MKESRFDGAYWDAPPEPLLAAGEVIPDGQGGVLAAWAWADTLPNPSTVVRGYVSRIASDSQSDYAMPFSCTPFNEFCWYQGYFGEIARAMVLGEHGVACMSACLVSWPSKASRSIPACDALAAIHDRRNRRPHLAATG